MNKNKQIYGVDSSKNDFNVVDSEGNHYQFKNDGNGFKLFLNILSFESRVVMEATGYYHYAGPNLHQQNQNNR